MNKIIFPTRYIQKYEATEILGVEASRLGRKSLVICDSFVLCNILPTFRKKLEKSIEIFIDEFNGECSDEEIGRLSLLAQKKDCNLIIAIGGGKVQDTAKSIAHNRNIPIIIVPTIVSTDTPCSSRAIIYKPSGEFKRRLALSKSSDLILIDTKIIAESPTRFLVSGMGDALATKFEIESRREKNKNENNLIIIYNLAQTCYLSLLRYGYTAKLDCDKNIVTPALEKIIETNTLLSGLCSGNEGTAAAHAIHYALGTLNETDNYHHGEKVAYGVLASLFLTNRSKETIDEVYSFCESIGLPTSFKDIGLSDISDEKLMTVAKVACGDEMSIHNEPIPIDPEMVFSALKKADNEGIKRGG